MSIQSVLLINLALFITLFSQASQANSSCDVQYTIVNEWGNGFTANVKVTHHGTALDGWEVTWDMPDNQQITGAWNGQYQQNESAITVGHFEWNRQVSDAGNIEFGFNASYNNINTIPTNIALNGTLCSGQTPIIEPDPEPELVACAANYTIVEQWNGGFKTDLRIENTGAALNNWEIAWTMPDGQVIDNLWNGHLSQNGDSINITPLNWNQTVNSNAEIQLGFTATYSSQNDIPDDIRVNGVLCEGQEPPPEPVTSCSVDYQIIEQWVEGFKAEVAILNTGDTLYEWQVEWNMPLSQTVTQLWNGNYQQDDSRVQVTAVDWNKTIATDGAIQFGFIATHQGLNPEPIDLNVNGVRCDGQADSVQLPPNAPTNLQTGILLNTSALLTWLDLSDNETGFVIERRFDNQSWQNLITLAAGTELYQDDNLLIGTTYQYRVAASNDAGLSAYLSSTSISLEDRNTIDTLGLVNNCASCHGTDGVSSGPAIPSIAGLGNDYLLTTMLAFQDGSRYSSMMDRVALGYTNTQIAQISDYFSTRAFVAAEQTIDMPLVQQGFTLQQERCAGCHVDGGKVQGFTGVILAGQWQPYLQETLSSYQQGLSSNLPNGMAAQLTGLTEQQLLALSHYYAANLTDEEISGANGNNTPLAVDDTFDGLQNQTLLLDVLANDTDADNGTLSILSVNTASHGTVVINAQQQIEYQPAVDYVGSDSFTYSIADSQGATAQATVNINVIADSSNVLLPSPVTNLSASVINNAWVQLNWTDNSANETGFKVQRKTADDEWLTLIEVSSDTTVYIDADILTGVSYEYAVTAFNNDGESVAQTVSASLLSSPAYGDVLYGTYSCNGCHGNNGEGGLSDVRLTGFGTDDLPSLISAIDERMPPSNPALCDVECATAIADYIVATFNEQTPDPLACTTAAPASTRSLRLLTRLEYQKTINDLLGLSEIIVHDLAEENRVGGFDNNINNNLVTSVRLEAYLDLAETLAAKVIQDNRAILLSCSTTDTPCATEFVQTFGKRAFRRPLSTDEVTHYISAFSSTSFDEALEETVMSMLSSPNFLYRSELGELQNDGTYQLTEYEIASSLSYLLWGTMPDTTLFLAADSGQLQTAEQRNTQATRLLADSRARTQAGSFAGQWLLASSPYVLPDKSSEIYPHYTDEVKLALSQEMIEFFNYVVFDSSALFSELYNADYVLANSTLAEYYALSTVSGNEFQVTPVNDGTRHGLLTLGALMSRYANSNESHPFKRGAFLFERLLCHDLPEPANMGVVTAPVVDHDATTRERFSFHSESATSCYECHQYIDGPGFGFENYDGAGQYRTMENNQLIDASGLLRGLETYTPSEEVSFTDINQLSTLLSQSETAAQCLATQYYRYSTGRQEDSYDECALDTFLQSYKDSGYDLKKLLLNQVSEAEFINRRAQ